jgi:tetratricopeptide (TPR) repeat protein
MLLFAVLAVFTVMPALADDSWMVAVTDKELYYTGESMEVSGYIVDRSMPEIAMSVYDPDGVILSANGVELQADDGFAKTISLDSPFYDKSGTYLIKFDYGQKSDQLTFDVIGTQIIQEEVPVPEIVPEVLFLSTDKARYADNEFITLSGMVSAMGDPSILIGVYDKNNSPTGFYTPRIDSDLSFSISFLTKSGVNFKTPGKYFAKAHYGESKETASFEFVSSPHVTPANNPNPATPQITLQPKITQQVPKQKEETKIDFAPQKPSSTPVIETRQEEQDNLSVEDKQLGEMLNEITLNCDYVEYTDSIVYYDGMGPALMRLCSYEQAISYFDKSLIKEPNDVGVITNKATAYSKLGKIDMALEYYDAALEIKPSYLPALNNKANALAQMGKFEESILIYNSILEKDPTYSISQANLQKASEGLVEYAKNHNQDESEIVNLGDADDSAGASIINYAKEPEKQPSLIDHIGNIFAGLFGFLS